LNCEKNIQIIGHKIWGNFTDFEGCNIGDDDDDDDENDAVIGGILPHILEQPSNPPLALLDRQLSSGVGFGGERQGR